MRSMGLIAACLMLLVAAPALGASSGELMAGRAKVGGRKTLGLLDGLFGILGLGHWSNDKFDIDIVNVFAFVGVANDGYDVKWEDKKNNDPKTHCSCKSKPCNKPDGSIDLLSVNINVFSGAILDVDIELKDLVIIKVEVVIVGGIKNYLYHCRSADGIYLQLVRAFVRCGRLHVVRAQCHKDNWPALYSWYRQSLLSYVLKSVLCLVDGVVGGLLGR